jgi:DNA end-binding protein Ku
MAASTWKGYLTFGLISIPIRLSPAARTERISFNQLHKVCHTRLKQPLFCPTCDRMVERSEVEKGYEYEKGQYLLFTQQELDDVEPDSARTMDILEFVKLEEIDPVYFDASYYVTPEDAGEKAYHLLTEAMEKSGYAGIAKITMHNRENIVIIRPREHGLALHTMFYSNEIRTAEEHGHTGKTEIKEVERTLAQQLIESLAAPFEPAKYHDAYQDSLQRLIEAKASGQKIAAVPHPARAPVVDLMEALKKSLASNQTAAAEKKPTLVRGPVRSEKPAKKQGRKVG